MSSLSLAMIVKNEEDVLERCLESVKGIFDEIVIVDSGSTDKTINIAKKYTDKIYSFEWQDDFAMARNYSFSQCTKDYIMWLDADDIVDNENAKALLELKQQLDNYDVIMLKYNIAFDKNNNPTFSYFRERIVRRSLNLKWRDFVHEVITPTGKIFHSDISICHKPLPTKKESNRNLKIYRKHIKNGVKLSARQMYYFSRELMYNGYFEEAIVNYEKFLNQNDAWVENKISACRDLAFCYHKTGEEDKSIESLLKAFKFDSPRAEICCDLGEKFFSSNKLILAKYWYEKALQCEPNIKSGAFIEAEYYDIIPYLQLCVINYKLGKINEAKIYNDLVGKIDKNNKSYLYNKEFFDKLN